MNDHADIQVLGPLARAWDITLTILSRPFRAWVWLWMAVLIFLTTVGEYGWIAPSKHILAIWDAAGGAVGGDTEYIAGMFIRAGLFAVAVPLLVFGVWLRSRALFCLYHSIAQGEPVVLSASKQYAKDADNYFRWSLVYVLLVLVVFAIVAFLSWLLGLAGAGSGEWAGGFIGGICFLVVAFSGMVLESVVAPVMYLKRRTAPEAAVIAWEVMVRPHMVAIIGVLAIRLAVYVSGMMIFGMLATWCCGLMPIFGTVLLLPLYLLLPVFALTFVDQFRPDFQVVGLHGQGLACMRCGHDLLATPDVVNCPKCKARVAPEYVANQDPEEEVKPAATKMTASEFRESMSAPKYDERPDAIDLDGSGAEAPKGAQPERTQQGQREAIDMDGPAGETPKGQQPERTQQGQREAIDMDGPAGETPKGQQPERTQQGQREAIDMDGPAGETPKAPIEEKPIVREHRPDAIDIDEPEKK
jgi:hypothetical protein